MPRLLVAASRPAVDPRNALGVAVFCVWAAGTLGLVAALARAGCVPSNAGAAPGSARGTVPTLAGWRARYDLPADHATAAIVVEHLATSRPPRGLTQEVRLHGGATAFADRLRALGRDVVIDSAPAPDLEHPALTLIAPGGQIAWRGRFNETDLRRRDGMILDNAVISQVAAGNPPPTAFVPYGCAIPIAERF